jgi:DNA-3-methyladenine glycosylase II
MSQRQRSIQDSPRLISVRAPFDLRLTVSALRRLPHAALYPLVEGEWRFMAALPTSARLIGVRSLDTQHPAASLEWMALDGPLAEVDAQAAAALVARMLDVQRDMAPFAELVEGEEPLATLARRLTGLKPPRFASLWEAFCQIVPFQQVSLSAAVATLNRFAVALGPHCEFEGRGYWGVPTPERAAGASVEELRACGMSAAKAQTLRGLAERALAGELEAAALDGLPDEEAIASLTRLPGIGRWSAQVALLRGLGRLSVFPSGDSGAARALREVFAESERPESTALATLERLRDWRGYLYFLLLGRRFLEGQPG